MYHVYQIYLSDDRYHEVNEMGWAHVSWGHAYLSATVIFDEKNVEGIVRNAVDEALYRFTKSIDAHDLEDVFRLGNFAGSHSEIEQKVHEHVRSKSVSVGDVIVPAGEQRGYVVLPVGFHELTQRATEKLVHFVRGYESALS